MFKFSEIFCAVLQYHGLTASLCWYSGALCNESDESSLHVTGSICKVSSNIIPLIHNYILPSEFQENIMQVTLLFSETSHMHHKFHSPKAHYNSLHPPVNFPISPTNTSLSTSCTKKLITLKPNKILSILLLTSSSYHQISPSDPHAPQISFP